VTAPALAASLSSLSPVALRAIAEAARAERARRSLHEFVRQGWALVEPAAPFVDGWHVGAICAHLEAVTRGEINRLLVNVPPGHAKSLIVSVLWPAWIWTQQPSFRGMFASYALDLAVRDSVRCRDLVESDWYVKHFTTHTDSRGASYTWRLKDDSNAKDMFANTASGFRLALGVGGASTGFRADLVSVDDPLNVKKAASDVERESAIVWWDRAMSSRFNDMTRQRRVIIMQRLHQKDLAGHVEAQGGYEILRLPSEFEPSRRCVTYVRRPNEAGELMRTELFRDPRTDAGELLFPAKFPAEVIEQAKKDLGSDYAAQHQQRPVDAAGGIFKRSHWRFWKPDGVGTDEQAPRPDGCYAGPARPLPASFDRTVLSLDANFKGVQAKGNDPVVFVVIGCKGADRFVLDRVRLFVGFNETLAHFRILVKKWPRALRRLVEDKANGSAIIETLREEIGGIIPVEPEGGKEARAHAVEPQVAGGNVYLPDGAPWLEEWVDEFAVFPRGEHDDQVDALTQALVHLIEPDGVQRLRALASR